MLRARPKDRYYVGPALITYSNMAMGVMAILIGNAKTFNSIKVASVLLIIAGLTDKLDGYVARRYGMVSEFGKQLDSLCDLVSFILAPAILVSNIGLESLGLFGSLSILLYIATGIFRLARYNIEDNGMYLKGIPSTIAGMIVAFKNIIDITYRIPRVGIMTISMENGILLLLLSVLMVSEFKIKKPF